MSKDYEKRSLGGRLSQLQNQFSFYKLCIFPVMKTKLLKINSISHRGMRVINELILITYHKLI